LISETFSNAVVLQGKPKPIEKLVTEGKWDAEDRSIYSERGLRMKHIFCFNFNIFFCLKNNV
jgi:hypothetical protein